ncbi:MAG: DUF378 domain-containing protein [Candidatus Saccharibacteria bacterium]|nr:DUF378 domain-containing protein [Candidatus Saccharibacteria bacterium]
MKMNAIDKVAYLLLVLGGIYWGTIGAFDYNVLDKAVGAGSGVARTVNILIGLAGLYGVYTIISMMMGDKKNTTKAKK